MRILQRSTRKRYFHLNIRQINQVQVFLHKKVATMNWDGIDDVENKKIKVKIKNGGFVTFIRGHVTFDEVNL